MTLPIPADPKIYHIIHVDRLPSIISDYCLWCDAEIVQRPRLGTDIGMNKIKQRRLTSTLTSHPDLHVGDCVPFYFCPRSIMLYVIHQANNVELSYKGGQKPIIHLEADLRHTATWAEKQNLRWAFALSNAGASYFEDRCELSALSEIDWDAVQTQDWKKCKEGKQAEFLVEKQFPWDLVMRIGVHSLAIREQVRKHLQGVEHQPRVEVITDWYY